MKRVILLHWKQEEIRERAAHLKGLQVDLYVPVQGEGMKGLKAFGIPDAFVISLERLPSHGRDIGWHLLQQKATRQIPLVYVGGEPEKVAKIRELLPQAIYASWADASDVIRRTLTNPAAAEVVRKPVALSAAPLHQKLGLKAGMHLALIGAPAPLETLVPGLPEGITIHEMPSPCKVDATLWFVRSEEEFLADFSEIAGLLGDKPRLWVFYRKGKGFGWTAMLETAAAHGLAQFKVMRLDELWSGVGFGRARGG